MSSLHSKMIELQQELKAPKGQYSEYGGYYYRSLEDILETVKPLNAKKGVRLTLSDEVVNIGDKNYVKAIATITDGNETIEVSAMARETVNKKKMDDSQLTGSASSYARKYALNGLYLIDDMKDADTDQYKQQVDNAPTNNSITPKQLGLIKTKSMEFGKMRNRKVEEVYKVLKINDLESLTTTQASNAIKQLDTWIKGAKK